MIKTKKLLSILILFLVSLTAVAATVVLNVSVSTDINNSSIIHGNTLLGTLTFSNNDTANYTINISNIGTTIPTSTISFDLDINSLLIANNSSNSTSYNIIVPQFTLPNNYTYDLTYFADNDLTDTVTETFSVVVPEDKTITKTIDNDEITTRNTTQDFVLLLNNSGNAQGSITNLSFPTLILNWDNSFNLTPSGNTSDITLSSNTLGNRTFTYTTNSSMEYGIYSGTLTYLDEDGTVQSETINLRVYEDSYDSKLKLTAEVEDITNDDTDTYPGDTIQIEDIEITNKYTSNNDDSVTDIELEYIVYFVTDGDDIVDETYSETFDLEKNDDTDKFDIEFQLPYDAEEGDYIIELIVTGEISSDGTDDGDEISNRLYLEFNVDKKSRHMIPKDLTIESYCPGETAELRIELVNIGERDLDDSDDMMIRVKIPSFNYDQWYNYTEDIDVGDTETTIINVDIPSTAAIGNHEVKIYSRHDGNSNSKLDGSYLLETLILSSTCTGIASSDTTILSGQTSEEGSQGMNTKYTLTVTNNGDSAVTYEVEVVGVEVWGAAVITPELLSVPAGETSSFSVYLQPGDNAQSTNNAVINLKSSGEIVASKTLTLTVSGISISTLTDALFGNTFTELENTSIVTIISLLIILGTAGGAIWLVHGDQIRSSQKNKRKYSKKKSRR